MKRVKAIGHVGAAKGSAGRRGGIRREAACVSEAGFPPGLAEPRCGAEGRSGPPLPARLGAAARVLGPGVRGEPALGGPVPARRGGVALGFSPLPQTSTAALLGAIVRCSVEPRERPRAVLCREASEGAASAPRGPEARWVPGKPRLERLLVAFSRCVLGFSCPVIWP